MSATVWYGEKMLAERLGISDGAIVQLRKSLKKNESKKEGGKFFIHETAAKRLLEDLGSPGLDISSCAEDNGSEPPAPTIVELTVRTIFVNPRLLLAARDDTGELVKVKVSNNINFRPRMKIKAREPLKADGPQFYILEGRCPRYRGHW
jgi:hypothetical protein